MNNKIFNNKILRIIVFTLSLLLLIILIHKIVKKYLLTKENFDIGDNMFDNNTIGGQKKYISYLKAEFKMDPNNSGTVNYNKENKNSDEDKNSDEKILNYFNEMNLNEVNFNGMNLNEGNNNEVSDRNQQNDSTWASNNSSEKETLEKDKRESLYNNTLSNNNKKTCKQIIMNLDNNWYKILFKI